jgi:LuxR family transcriptional regulator, quorum-sensing system regulator SdiA
VAIGFEFNRARSLSHALDVLVDEARALGFDAVDYGFMPSAHDGNGAWNAPDIQSRNFPPRWSRGWKRYSSHDPFLWRCYERNLPLDWNDVKGAPWLTDIQHEAIGYIENLGFLDGVSVPIHLSGQSFAFVSGLSHAPRGRWREQPSHAVQDLFVLAHAFHAAVKQHVHVVVNPGAAIVLTRRETEVLKFAATGLNAPATARAIHRSVETVRRQRKSAMQKLNAHTIAQAVARAMSLGLLERSASLK